MISDGIKKVFCTDDVVFKIRFEDIGKAARSMEYQLGFELLYYFIDLILVGEVAGYAVIVIRYCSCQTDATRVSLIFQVVEQVSADKTRCAGDEYVH